MPEPTTHSAVELGSLITGLGGGLAMFLYGMRQMTESLKTVAGTGMKTLLARLTANKFTAALAGTIITGIVQSSSVTTVLVVGFISAGLMTLNQSIGVIIGANIGTTITAQIIAFQIYKYGLLMIAVGFFVEIMARREKLKQWSIVLMGLGLIFFGMELMSSATGPLREWPPFIEMMQRMRNPLLGILAGALFTGIVQSSSATTGIVIVLAVQGLISLESGIGLIFGANIGTCVTAIASAFGRPREAVQAAWIHVLFNVGGVLLWMFFIPQFADLVRYISPVSATPDAAVRLAGDVPRQIANAHTVFNVVNAFVFIWFTGPLARLVERIVPPREEHVGLKPKFLDEMFLEQPALALDQVRRELARLAELDRGMLGKSFYVATEGSRHDIESLAAADDEVDELHGAIIAYLGRLSQQNLVEPQPKQLYQYIGVANYLEYFADVIDNNLLDNARKRVKLGIRVSPATIRMLRPIHNRICLAFDQVIDVLNTGDQTLAQEAAGSKAAVNELAEQAAFHLATRLVAKEPNRVAAFQIETDVIEDLKRLHTLTRRIARALLMVNPDTAAPDENALEAGAEHSE